MIMPIKTLTGIADKDLEKFCTELENQGYRVTQRKKEVIWDDAKKKSITQWTLKAKLNNPPSKPGRLLVD